MLSLFWSAFFGNMFVSLCFSVPHSNFFDFNSSYFHQFPSSLDPSNFITSVDHVFSPFRSVELSYFDEFIWIYCFSMFFLPYFRRNSLFQWHIFFLVEVSNCFFHVYPLLISMNSFGRNSLFHVFFVPGSVETIFSFFRILISVKIVRSFGAFFFSPLIPIEILGDFLSSVEISYFGIFFLPPFSRQNSVLIGNIILFTSYSRQNSVFSEIYFFPVLFKPKFDEIRFFLIWFFGDLFVSLRSRGISLLWRFIFSLPYSHLFASKPLISVIYFLFCNFSTLSFFLQFLGKTPK